jgi:5-methylcytosine-specific restriction endonuclease McrA
MNELKALENLLYKKQAKSEHRQYIFDQFGNRCAYCQTKENLTQDHVKPRHKGGTDTTFNIVPACEPCNRGKGSKEWKEWYRKEASWEEESEQKIQDWLNCGGN